MKEENSFTRQQSYFYVNYEEKLFGFRINEKDKDHADEIIKSGKEQFKEVINSINV